MPDIPQITNPITSKNYNYSSRQTDPSTAPFDIVQLTQVDSSEASPDKQARSQLNLGQHEIIPLSVQVARDPTLAVEMLKDLLNTEILNQALVSGHTEFYAKLDKLAKHLYLSPENITEEIINQEKQNTMFSGKEFYNILREIAKTTTNQDVKDAIGALLKSLNFAQNKNEILGALSANIKFLSEYFSPNEQLSNKLAELSVQWGASDANEYFELLKTQTLAILKDVSTSLLNDEKTQTLLPMIVHNLSRYNTNSYLIKENFNYLLTLIPSNTLSEALKNAFTHLIKELYPDNALSNPSPNNNTINQAQNQDATENNSINRVSDFLSKSLANDEYFINIENPSEMLQQNLRAYQSGRTSGLEAIKNSLQSLIIGNEGRKVIPTLISDFSSFSTVSDVIDYLNTLLSEMPDIPLRQEIYEVFSKIIENMAVKNELPPVSVGKPLDTVLDSLTVFIKENINHPILKSLDSFNAANLLQSLLNAPGVFTPLAHYILPLQIENTRAFGELWVDNDEKNPNSTPAKQRNYHMFLTFDVEAIGRFELDMYAFGEDINISMLYPSAFGEKAEIVKEKTSKIIKKLGYNPKSFESAVLKAPHTLTDIFPKILEKRTNFNIII